MRLEWQIVAGLALDFAFGDPRWLPHPVRLIGRFALALEGPARRALSPWAAGGAVAGTVLATTAIVTWSSLELAGALHPLARDILAVLLLWMTVAARDLAGHAAAVYRALAGPDLTSARARVALMVGRDTDALDQRGVVRAAVESVGENTVDGVTAPLFFGCLFGPVGAMVYKAASTLDSTFGYRSPRYIRFGWASARLDDAANFIPARLNTLLVATAAALLRLRAVDAIRVCLRDGRKHPSPNAGLAEASFAGALGVQLGGPISYGGQPSFKPTLGDPLYPLQRQHIGQAIRLMLVTTVVTAVAFLAARWAVTS